MADRGAHWLSGCEVGRQPLRRGFSPDDGSWIVRDWDRTEDLPGSHELDSSAVGISARHGRNRERTGPRLGDDGDEALLLHKHQASALRLFQAG